MENKNFSIRSSRFPEKEAERFILHQNIKQGKYLFVVIGAGQGYLAKKLSQLYPGSRILSFFLDDNLSHHVDQSSGGIWSPHTKISLHTFLQKNIEDFLLPVIKVIQWKPCIKAYPQIYDNIMAALYNYVNERNASIVTTINFGKRWLRNACMNSLRLSDIVTCTKVHKPVVIAASGPSLSFSLPVLISHRHLFFLVALPSSLKTLHHAGMIPDLIVNTDAGFWNTHHFMRYPHTTIPIAMPLTSTVHKGKNPVLLLNQNTFIEKKLVSSLGVPALTVPQNGTVAGTALFLAYCLSSLPIIYTGLDLSYEDIHEHVYPHTFSSLFESSQTRLAPLLTILYERKYNGNILNNRRQSRSLHTYERWFNSSHFQNTVYRLNPSSIKLHTLQDLNNREFTVLLESVSTAFRPFPFVHQYQNQSILRKRMTETIEDIKSHLKQEESDAVDFNTLDSLSSFFKKRPELYEILEMVAFQQILNGVKELSLHNVFTRKKMKDSIASVKNFIGTIYE